MDRGRDGVRRPHGRGSVPSVEGWLRVAKGGRGERSEDYRYLDSRSIRHRALRARTSRAPACGAVGAGPGPARWQLPCGWPRPPAPDPDGPRPSPDLALCGGAGRGPTLCPPGRLCPSPGRSPVRGAGEARGRERGPLVHGAVSGGTWTPRRGSAAALPLVSRFRDRLRRWEAMTPHLWCWPKVGRGRGGRA